MILLMAVLCIGAFSLGSIPFGRIIGLLAAGIDVRQVGSGNIGATNVAREIGLVWGGLTLLLDMLKGLIPVLVSQEWVGPDASGFAGSVVGLAALTGHQFSLFQRFSGGKGVATALGVFLGISPAACLVGLLVFGALVYRWGFVSLGSIGASCAVPLALLALGEPGGVVLVGAVAAGLICFRHRENIRRLIAGNEPKWAQGRVR